MLEVFKGHELAQLTESSCQILRAIHHSVLVAHADVLGVDMAEHLCITLALNGHGTVDFNVAFTIMINWLNAVDFTHLNQNERNGTSLVLKVDVHTLFKHLLTN